MAIMQINSHKLDTAEQIFNYPPLNGFNWNPNNSINSDVDKSVSSRTKKTWSRVFNFLSTFGLGAAAGGAGVTAALATGFVSLSLTPANPLLIAIGAVALTAFVGLVAVAAGSAIARKLNVKHAEKDLEVIKPALEEHKKLYATDGVNIWPDKHLLRDDYNPEVFKDENYRTQYVNWLNQVRKVDVAQKLDLLSEGCAKLDEKLKKHRPVINCSWQEAIKTYKERFSTLQQQIETSNRHIEEAKAKLKKEIENGADAVVQQRLVTSIEVSTNLLARGFEQLDKEEKDFFTIAGRRGAFIDKQIQAQELYVRELKAR